MKKILVVIDMQNDFLTGSLGNAECAATAEPVRALLARGGYTGRERPVLFVVLTRSEMAYLRRVVAEIDPQATVVVGKIHEAFGNGFNQI